MVASWLVSVLGPLAGAAQPQGLVPAGSINGALAEGPRVVIVGEDPELAEYTLDVQRRFFPDARVLAASAALEADLSGVNLIVYGSARDNAWIAEHAAALPAAWEDGALELDGRRFEGEHLRAILAVRNPADPDRRALVYTAAAPADVVGINALFHGPTEWVIADGGQVLASGSYLQTGALSPEVVQSDLELLVATLEDVHPATAQGVPESVSAAIRAARAAVREPLDRLGFWRVANELLLSLGDAHTSVTPLTSGETINLPLVWLEEGLFVARATSQLARGDRVLTIGGLSPDDLFAGLTRLIPAETPNWVRHRGERELASVGILRELGVEPGSDVRVTLERGGEERAVRLPLGEAVEPTASEPWARFALEPAHDLAIFTLDRCVLDDLYRGQVRAFFDAVTGAGIGRIAVDVRQNSGGHSGVLNEFLRYLDLEEYSGYSGAIRVSEQSLAQSGASGLQPGYHEFGPRVVPNPPVEGATRFGGEIFVLTSNGTFSSGNWFAVVIGDNGIGTVVGEPTGNAPSAFGELLQFELPGTCLSYQMSHKRWIRPEPGRDPAPCLEPDRHVPLTRADLVANRDPVLDALRRP